MAVSPARLSPSTLACTATDAEHTAIVERCLAGAPLPRAAAARLGSYVALLLAYNERTNVYSKSAYEKLPFHVHDSIALALQLEGRGALLDIGSGSGLPSMIVACVHPEMRVYAVESKSRKTRFLQHAARKIGLSHYRAITCNVHELSRSWVFDVDVVSAKAFKPLLEVEPIARRCIISQAQLMVPISSAQVAEFSLTEQQLVRSGEFIYYSQRIEPSHGSAQRKLVTIADCPELR
ncbi:hypothetical protein AB1Y20_009194 [Prymnesium parvum]|uniref:Uncharacterized protein n=1 Tax=Prymnesium parvum TaxID=97485 RepID=A0AB34K0Q3_PRYPA